MGLKDNKSCKKKNVVLNGYFIFTFSFALCIIGPCSIVLDVFLELWNATTGCTLRPQLLIRTRFSQMPSFEILFKFPEKKYTSIVFFFSKEYYFIVYYFCDTVNIDH